MRRLLQPLARGRAVEGGGGCRRVRRSFGLIAEQLATIERDLARSDYNGADRDTLREMCAEYEHVLRG